MSHLSSRMDKGKLIAKGLTANVYAWGDGRVLKLFERSRPAAKVEREYEVARAVHAAGIAAPVAHEIVEVEGCKGIVFERVDGPSMYESVVSRPWRLFTAARQLAELHAQLHRLRALAELPSQRQQVEGWIAAAGWPEAQKQAARHALSELPDGDVICHGDFHPANILLTQRGPVIIDWSTGSRGHPLGDVALTSVLFESANLPEDAPLHIQIVFKFSRALLHRTYLRRYLQVQPGTRRQIEAWRPVVLAHAAAWQAEHAK